MTNRVLCNANTNFMNKFYHVLAAVMDNIKLLCCFPPLAVYFPVVIQNQMRLSQFIMLKAFLSATTAGIKNSLGSTLLLSILQWIMIILLYSQSDSFKSKFFLQCMCKRSFTESAICNIKELETGEEAIVATRENEKSILRLRLLFLVMRT